MRPTCVRACLYTSEVMPASSEWVYLYKGASVRACAYMCVCEPFTASAHARASLSTALRRSRARAFARHRSRQSGARVAGAPVARSTRIALSVRQYLEHRVRDHLFFARIRSRRAIVCTYIACKYICHRSWLVCVCMRVYVRVYMHAPICVDQV